MQEIKAFLRRERAQSVVAALRNAGVPRLTLSHVHSLGSGVDPEHYRLSFEEGGAPSSASAAVRERPGPAP